MISSFLDLRLRVKNVGSGLGFKVYRAWGLECGFGVLGSRMLGF